MKHNSFTAISLALCLVWAFAAVIPCFGDEATAQWATVVLESFNGDSDYAWKLDASKFTTKTAQASYPQLTFVGAWPAAVFGYNRDGSKDVKSLGIHGRFDRRGYNWIDVYPSKGGNGDDKDDPVEIPIPGRVRSIDLWVWGSNLDYYVEVYLRDLNGVVHSLKLGSVMYTGWKNLRVNVPTNIAQTKRVLPRKTGLTFVKFRIWTQPTEKIGDFYIYLNQFKILTDTFESLFDGDDLGDPAYVQELWANGTN
jgi:hypothetical protein